MEIDGGARRGVDPSAPASVGSEAERDERAIGEVVSRYELEIDFGTIPELAASHGLRLDAH